MHGRLKVRTTAEQEERKRIEREKKLKLYKYAMCECLERNRNSRFDESLLKITEEVLTSNGDIQTLWNMRKETIDKFEREKLFEEGEMIKFYAAEMAITEQCLKKNPKSYSCWHHRRWCLARSNILG
jgi:geranylgeranyl transferase type-2 subunit alpha